MDGGGGAYPDDGLPAVRSTPEPRREVDPELEADRQLTRNHLVMVEVARGRLLLGVLIDHLGDAVAVEAVTHATLDARHVRVPRLGRAAAACDVAEPDRIPAPREERAERKRVLALDVAAHCVEVTDRWRLPPVGGARGPQLDMTHE